MLGAAAAGIVAFLVLESRVSSPLMPLGLLRLRSVATSNVVGILWSAAMFAMFFLGPLPRSCSATPCWRSASRSCRRT